ncbi:unnamed protein product [Citrullus colocynthis]|uniref:PGG domain-containing protein n=1 Tax=Citrullus colocynthis TaxID=252529 RepID=A0ABP0Z3C5_9ROSI
MLIKIECESLHFSNAASSTNSMVFHSNTSLWILRRYPYLAIMKDTNEETTLHVMARKPSDMDVTKQLSSWELYINSSVENRLENVFNLINEIGRLNEFTAKYRTFKGRNYNILHLAGHLAAPNHLNRVSGAAFQMQRELLWFKEVEKIVLPSQLEAKSNIMSSQRLKVKFSFPNVPKLTPRQLFTQEHKDLRKEGEEWMKNTANSCMLVATLISTVVFAAAFTVPGGSSNNDGTPVFQHKFWFTVFVMSDAVALFSSSTSILMFMSILTSRYAEEDFLHSLPSRLLFGLATLFISIVCMVVAFSATFFILYHKANICIPTIVSAMAILPVICFCLLQFKLWVDIFHNTYSSRFLFKPRRRKLF